MQDYKITNINKDGEIIEDLSKYPIPEEIQKEIWEIIIESQRKVKVK